MIRSSAAERTPSPELATPARPRAASGRLVDRPLVHILVHVLDRGLSGTLTLREPDDTEHRIILHGGAPNAVVTGRRIAPLGGLLASLRLMPSVSAASAVVEARDAGLPLGPYLLAHKLVDPGALAVALESQLERKLAAITRATERGTFAFQESHDDGDAWRDPILVRPLHLILECARVWSQHDEMAKLLSTYAHLPLEIHPDSRIEQLTVGGCERAIVARLRARRCTLAELWAQERAATYEALGLLYVMFVSRQFRIDGFDRAPLDPVAPSWRPAPPPPDSARPRFHSSVRPRALRQEADDDVTVVAEDPLAILRTLRGVSSDSAGKPAAQAAPETVRYEAASVPSDGASPIDAKLSPSLPE